MVIMLKNKCSVWKRIKFPNLLFYMVRYLFYTIGDLTYQSPRICKDGVGMAKCQYTGMCKLLTCGSILILSCFLRSPYVCLAVVFVSALSEQNIHCFILCPL